MQEATQPLLELDGQVNTFVWRWKKWDVRADGKVFWCYSKSWKSGERWVTWDQAIKSQNDHKARSRRYYLNNPDKCKERSILCRTRNKDKYNATIRVHRKKNKEKLLAYQRKWETDKRRSDEFYSFKGRIRRILTKSFNRGGFPKTLMSHDIFGCDWTFLKSHIEDQFTDGMGWDNRDQWHIDHIVPLASAKTPEDVVRLNHYSNLRPLWAIDNLKKGAKILPTEQSLNVLR